MRVVCTFQDREGIRMDDKSTIDSAYCGRTEVSRYVMGESNTNQFSLPFECRYNKWDINFRFGRLAIDNKSVNSLIGLLKCHYIMYSEYGKLAVGGRIGW